MWAKYEPMMLRHNNGMPPRNRMKHSIIVKPRGVFSGKKTGARICNTMVAKEKPTVPRPAPDGSS